MNLRGANFLYVQIIVAILILFFYFNFPIYPDEITNQYLSSLSSIYDSTKIYLIESCNPNKSKIGHIIRYINNIYSLPYEFINNNLYFRYFHIFIGISLFFILTSIINRNNKSGIYSIILFLWPLSLINTFIIIRPEFYILLSLIFCVSYYNNKNFIYYIGLILSYCIALNAHPKAIIYSPLIIFTLLNESKYHLKIYFKIAISFIILYIIYLYVNLYKELYTTCLYPQVNDIISRYQVSPLLFFSDPILFFKGILNANDLIRLDRSLSQIFIRNNYDIGYLPNIVKYTYIYNIANFIYLYLLVNFFSKYVKLDKSYFKIFYLSTVFLVFILNGNKAVYDIFLLINSMLLFTAIKGSK